MKTCVVTGASGLVGANMAIALLAAGHRVRCIRRPHSKIAHLADFPIEWVFADIEDLASLIAAFSGADAVFHCAALVDMERKLTPSLMATNIHGTQNVVNAAKQAQIARLIHCSSIITCALSDDDQPVDESHPWNYPAYGMAFGYAQSKYQSEAIVKEAAKRDLDAVIVNPTFVFGPFDPKPSSGKLLLDLFGGRMFAHVSGCNNFVDVRDVAQGMLDAWLRGRRGERYILGGYNLDHRDFFDLCASIAGVRAPRWRVPSSLTIFAGWIGEAYQAITRRKALINAVSAKYAVSRRFVYSSQKAVAELHYQVRPLEQSIQDTLAWFKQQRML